MRGIDMKKIAIASALAISLAACSPAAQQSLVNIVNDVQIATQTACKFVPTATTIADIIAAGSATVPSQIANVICAAVNGATPTPTLGAGPMRVLIDGKTIQVTGYFTK